MLGIVMIGWDVENMGEFIFPYFLGAILIVAIFLVLFFGVVVLSFVLRRKAEREDDEKEK